ncbi:MAG: tRNA lysidine(34) synthetase TilS [Clostridia bacterium]|nr:tRNA lysidine(34) synthetase TilS [Clostridia bacterium]
MITLSKYAGKRICVAVSGGKDSMALLYFLKTRGGQFDITVCALNCNHKMRPQTSDRDSTFVKDYCAEQNIPLLYFEWETDAKKTERSAREWRLECYERALRESNADFIATAHHMNDNAETVLFNLARGSSLSGLTGICDGGHIIRPLIGCTRAQIDAYVLENNIPFVEDETNFTDDYTRNKIRHNVLPEFEKAVPEATKAIYRFSRLAMEDEQYFEDVISERGIITRQDGGVHIKLCEEKVIFRRAVVKVIKEVFKKKDYTSATADRLYELQFVGNGKRYEFLGLTAFCENGGIVIAESGDTPQMQIPFQGLAEYAFGQYSLVFTACPPEGQALKFDLDKIPPRAVIRTMKTGDKFTKFGGGTKSLGDWFTDKKIPVRLRGEIPLVADGENILIVCGYEISDNVKVTKNTHNILYALCARNE